MKVVWTEDALRDLDEIATYLAVHYSAIAPAVERRIGTAVAWIAASLRAGVASRLIAATLRGAPVTSPSARIRARRPASASAALLLISLPHEEHPCAFVEASVGRNSKAYSAVVLPQKGAARLRLTRRPDIRPTLHRRRGRKAWRLR
jgi:plasmid stabilization system protein ParE